MDRYDGGSPKNRARCGGRGEPRVGIKVHGGLAMLNGPGVCKELGYNIKCACGADASSMWPSAVVLSVRIWLDGSMVGTRDAGLLF